MNTSVNVSRQPAGAPHRTTVLVCGGSVCGSPDAQDVLHALEARVTRRGLAADVHVAATGCRGFCAVSPIVIVLPRAAVDGGPARWEDHL